MGVVKNKYRGTTKYSLVFAELVRAAQDRGVTTYQDIAVIIGLRLKGSHMAGETGYVLGEISEDEVQAGRPMLSAVAVSIKGRPGPGFYDLAHKLSRLPSKDEDLEFWEKERQAVYETWRRSPRIAMNAKKGRMTASLLPPSLREFGSGVCDKLRPSGMLEAVSST